MQIHWIPSKSSNEIEDDLSIIMDHYEVRGFKLGFRVGFKAVISFSQEDINV